MDRDDILDLLSIIAASDHRTIGETDVVLWQQMIGGLAKDDAVTAIMSHLNDQPGVWLTPGHVVQRAKAIVADRYDRMDPDDRANAYAELGGGTRATTEGKPVRRDRYGYIDKSAPDPEPYPPDWTPEQRVAAYWSQLRNGHRTPEPAAPAQDLPWFDPQSMPPCPDCGSTRSCNCHEYDTRPWRHPDEEMPLASPEHIRRCRAWFVQQQAARHGEPIPSTETAGSRLVGEKAQAATRQALVAAARAAAPAMSLDAKDDA